jgi:hypothetical protein
MFRINWSQTIAAQQQIEIRMTPCARPVRFYQSRLDLPPSGGYRKHSVRRGTTVSTALDELLPAVGFLASMAFCAPVSNEDEECKPRPIQNRYAMATLFPQAW